MGESVIGMSGALLRSLSVLGLSVACVIALAACSNSKKEDQPYLHSKAPPPLEVPPALAAPKQDSDTALPQLPPTAPTAEVGIAPPNLLKQAQVPEETTPPATASLHIEKQGAQRWLVVPAPVDQTWVRVKSFLVEQGFTLARADEKTGMLETDWRDAPQAAGKNGGDSGLQGALKNKFKVHVAAGRVAGSSEVTVANLGLQKVVAKGAAQWQPRAADPKLEAALLDKLQEYFREKEDTSAAADLPAVKAMLSTDSTTGVSTLSLNEDFDRAWRRIGATLHYSGFVITDRNRSEGVYLVRLGDAFKDDAKSGFVSQLFGDDADETDKRYRIHVKDGGDKATVGVEHPGGAPVHTSIGERILTRLKDKMG